MSFTLFPDARKTYLKHILGKKISRAMLYIDFVSLLH